MLMNGRSRSRCVAFFEAWLCGPQTRPWAPGDAVRLDPDG